MRKGEDRRKEGRRKTGKKEGKGRGEERRDGERRGGEGRKKNKGTNLLLQYCITNICKIYLLPFKNNSVIIQVFLFLFLITVYHSLTSRQGLILIVFNL